MTNIMRILCSMPLFYPFHYLPLIFREPLFSIYFSQFKANQGVWCRASLMLRENKNNLSPQSSHPSPRHPWCISILKFSPELKKWRHRTFSPSSICVCVCMGVMPSLIIFPPPHSSEFCISCNKIFNCPLCPPPPPPLIVNPPLRRAMFCKDLLC